MAIDIRATVSCNVGGTDVTLISASISDDYVQGTGLIKCKGSCEISGVITPAVGTAVTFSYTKSGVTRSIPRKLRVLSSFADPFRCTTQLELGCKLTYLSDLQEKVKWGAFDDSENSSLTSADAEIITIPIYANSVAAHCCLMLGIGGAPALTNAFSIKEFDFSAGYVSILSDLMVSESICGYLNKDETLVTFSLDQGSGKGPVIDKSKIIDLGPIGVGQLPGEAVAVSYNTLKLKNSVDTPTDESNIAKGPGWDRVTASTIYAIPIPYQAGGISTYQTFNILETVTTNTTYATLQINGEEKRVVTRRTTTEMTSSAAIAGGLVTEYLTNGISFNTEDVYKYTTETFKYDINGNESEYTRYVEGSVGHLACTANVPWVFGPNDYVTLNFSSLFPLEAERRLTTTAGDRQHVETMQYGPWAKTIAGQQSIAAGRDTFTNSGNVATYLGLLYDPALNPSKSEYGLSLIDHRVNIQRKVEAQFAPSQADINNASNADTSDATNNYRTESTSELELALGSPTAQRRIELSMPYAPDDRFFKVGSSPATYYSLKSDAPAKAARYGRCQNRLLLGNRNGMNIQTLPELLPAAPFSPIIVQANGLSAMYRTNGTSWQMSADGVLVSTDALFYGAVGGTGTFWFPVAPGITTLPTTPAVEDGQMTVSSVMPVWNETMKVNGRLRVGIEVKSLPYSLTLLTAPNPISTRITLEASPILKVNVTAATVLLAAAAPSIAISAKVQLQTAAIAVQVQTPGISTGKSLAVPVSAVALAAATPIVSSGAALVIPTVDMTISGPAPVAAGTLPSLVDVPSVDTAITALAPNVKSGASTIVPAFNVGLDAQAPSYSNGLDFAKVKTLLHFNNSWADSSNYAVAVSTFASPLLDTSIYKFGSGSLKTNGGMTYWTMPAVGTNDFTVELWIRPTASTSAIDALIFSSTNSGGFRIERDNTVTSPMRLLVKAQGTTVVSSGATTELTDGVWSHVAVTKASGVYRLFVNGVDTGTGSTNTSSITVGTAYLGRSGGGGQTLYANIDDFRLVVGAALYTSNFTLPTSAFPDS